jgi:general secretion pathway protein K
VNKTAHNRRRRRCAVGAAPYALRRTHKGSILIVALWSLCILSTFAVILGYGVRSKIMLIRRLEERDKCYFIAQAGIKRAIAYLKAQAPQSYDCLTDSWANNEAVFKDISVDNGTFSIIAPYSEQVRYGLADEESKININSADRAVLRRLFQYVLGMDEIPAQELAACIVDWRDNDSELSLPIGSAEDRYYTGLDYPYGAKDNSFEMLDELLLVKGITQEYYEKLRGYITVYGSGRVNVNTAGKAVLFALGLNEKTAEIIVSYRNGEDAMPGTGDDIIFLACSDIAPKLAQVYHLGDSEIAQINNVAERYLSTGSTVFAVESLAALNNRKDRAMQVICVFGRSGNILYWREL